MKMSNSLPQVVDIISGFDLLDSNYISLDTLKELADLSGSRKRPVTSIYTSFKMLRLRGGYATLALQNC
jgi:hypothetical protein